MYNNNTINLNNNYCEQNWGFMFNNTWRHFHTCWVRRRTTAAGFHMQNMCDVWVNTLEYWSKYTHFIYFFPYISTQLTLCPIHHHHWAAVVSRGWAKASAGRLQVSLSCAALCHIVSLQYLSRSSLHRLAGLPCRLFLSYGLQVVTCEVHSALNIKLLEPLAQGASRFEKSLAPPKLHWPPIFSNDVSPSKTVVDIKTSK